MQETMFDVPRERSAEYAIYHDESGVDVKRDRFLLQGALFIPVSRWKDTLDSLITSRNGYGGRLHFVNLRDKTSSKRGESNWSWIDLYFRSLSYYCPFKCMIADRKSNHQRIRRFSTEHELYNYTALQAIHGGISWSLSGYQRVGITIHSEEMTRATADNFATYVPRQLLLKLNRYRRPDSNSPLLKEPVPTIHMVNGNPETVSEDDRGHCQFIQLADILTSAVSQAVNASASQQIKIDLGSFIASWIQDTRMPPWLQGLDLHRRFSVSCFPDSTGGFFDVPLSIVSRDQMELL